MSGCVTHVAHVDGQTLVWITGELDVSSAPRLAEMLVLFDGPVVLDCSRLEFVDAAGLEVLARAAREHDGLTLRNAPLSLAQFLEATGLADVVHLEGSTPD